MNQHVWIFWPTMQLPLDFGYNGRSLTRPTCIKLSAFLSINRIPRIILTVSFPTIVFYLEHDWLYTTLHTNFI